MSDRTRMTFRQLRLISAGVQDWSRHTLASSEDHYAYCSTLSVYIHCAKTFQLQRVLAGHPKNINAVVWSRINKSIIATSCLDGRVRIWNIYQGDQEAAVSFTCQPVCIDCSHLGTDVVAIATENGSVHLWAHSSTEKDMKEVYSRPSIPPSAISWSPKKKDTIAIGFSDGYVVILSTSTRKTKLLVAKDASDEVFEVQWDILSQNYLLVGYKKGLLVLWDSEEGSELRRFNTQDANSVQWLPWAPGNFVTTGPRSGILRLWNVSQNQPLDNIRVHSQSFRAAAVHLKSKRLLGAFSDGTACVFNLQRRCLDWTLIYAHKETIFDVAYKPSSHRLLATGSYDATCKLWHLPAMECLATLVGHKGPIYSLSWAPGDDTRLVTSSAEGEIIIWDTERGIALHKEDWHCGNAVFKVDWNKRNPRLIASASGDSTVLVFSDSAVVERKYTLPGPAYGCCWAPMEPNMLAVGCHDGVARVFDVASGESLPLFVGKSHKSRVFSTSWSPLLENTFASASDDQTICIWNTKSSSQPKVLRGHTHNVRGLCWSSELANLLVSGSWDGCIRLWDVFTGVCLGTIADHAADVYGISSHWQTPFVFVTTSRDTTLRFWSLECRTLAYLKPLAIAAGTLSEELLNTNSNVSDMNLRGLGSARLIENLQKPAHVIHRYAMLLRFFFAIDGLEDMIGILAKVKNVSTSQLIEEDKVIQATPYLSKRILHIDELLPDKRRQLEKLENVKRTFSMSMKKEDALLEIANGYLKIGDLRKYCELHAQLGNWEKALAIAPAVSLAFWQSLMEEHATSMDKELGEEALPFWLASGNVQKALQLLDRNSQLHDSLTVLAADGFGSFPAESGQSRGINEDLSCRFHTFSQLDFARKLKLKEMCCIVADRHKANGQPVLMACAYLAVEDFLGAVTSLLQSQQILIAFLLSRCLDLQYDFVYSCMTQMLLEQGHFESAVTVAQMQADPQYTLPLLCAGFTGSSEELKQLTDYADILPLDKYAQLAETQQASKDRAIDAVKNFVFCREYRKGALLGLSILKDKLQQTAVLDLNAMIGLCEILSSIDMAALSPSTRDELLAYQAYIGAQKAMWRAYWRLVSYLFSMIRMLVRRSKFTFPISQSQMLFQESSYLAFFDIEKAKKNLLQIEKVHIDPQRWDNVQQNIAYYEKNEGLGGVLAQSNMRGNVLHSSEKSMLSSLIDGSRLKSTDAVVLEDGVSVISKAQAWMLYQVFPFSPLCTGKRLSKYVFA